MQRENGIFFTEPNALLGHTLSMSGCGTKDELFLNYVSAVHTCGNHREQ